MRRVFMPGLLVALAACQAGRDFKRPELNAPASFRAPVPPDGRTQDLARWWENFHDPELSARVVRALENNPDMRAAENRVRASRALAQAARGSLWPTTEAFGAWLLRTDRSRPGPVLSNPATEIPVDLPSVRWDLDVFGGARRGIEASQAGASGARWRAWGVRVALAADTARQEILARGLGERIRFARENAAAQEDTLKLAEARPGAGRAAGAEAARARAQLAVTRAAVPPLEEARAGALNRLAVLMGETPGLLEAGGQAIPEAPLPAPGLPVDTLRRRPDVALAETALHEATALIGVEEAELYPRFSLSSSVHASVGSPDDLLTGSSYTLSAGPQMRWRVFDRARIRQRVAAAGANAEAALNAFDATVLNALGEVENALAAVSHGAERVARLETAERESRLSAAAARALYEQGAGGLEAVLTEQQRLLSVQDALAEARTRRALAGVTLYQALGGGWEEPEKAVERQKKPR